MCSHEEAWRCDSCGSTNIEYYGYITSTEHYTATVDGGPDGPYEGDIDYSGHYGDSETEQEGIRCGDCDDQRVDPQWKAHTDECEQSDRLAALDDEDPVLLTRDDNFWRPYQWREIVADPQYPAPPGGLELLMRRSNRWICVEAALAREMVEWLEEHCGEAWVDIDTAPDLQQEQECIVRPIDSQETFNYDSENPEKEPSCPSAAA